jgi:hypothetical protein
MKKLTRIIIWAMLSIMMQVAGLMYLDKVYFKEASNFEKVQTKPREKDREINYSISSTAKDIKVSDDARYISYFENNKLMVLDTKSLNLKEVLTDKNREILYCHWILNENILMIGEKVSDNKSTQKVKILTYNMRKDSEDPITELCDYEEGIEIDEIVSSTKTNTNYVGVSRTGYNSKIYRIGIEGDNDVKNIGNTIPELGSIEASQRNDVLVYEDSLNKIFYSYTNGKNKKLDIENATSKVLIGVDDENRVYMGELIGEKITKISYGKYDSEPSTWKDIVLDKPKDAKDIYLNGNNEILVNDNLTGKITNLTTNKSVEYSGQLLKLTDKIICSINDNKIQIKSLSDMK